MLASAAPTRHCGLGKRQPVGLITQRTEFNSRARNENYQHLRARPSMAPMASPTTDLEITINADDAVRNLKEVTRRLEDAAVAHTRSGMRTTEFWVSAATIVLTICTALATSLASRTDHISTAIVTAASVIAAALTALGYSASRARAKAGAIDVALTARNTLGPGAVPSTEIPARGP